MCIRFVVSLCLLLLCYPLHANPIATEDFARLPAFSNPQISPDGNFLASTLLHNGNFLLVVQDFSNNASKQKPVLIPFEGVHIHRYYWANNERLIVTVCNGQQKPDKKLSTLFKFNRAFVAQS